MLLSRTERDRIARQGNVTVFRRWRRASVKVGGALRTAIGVVAVDALDQVEPAELGESDATTAGHGSLQELQRALDARGKEGAVYRIRLRLAGEDPRIALREDAVLDGPALRELQERLARLDGREPWTFATLALIAERPQVRAEELARALGQEKLAFKRNVRRLKELGLTESLDVGYRLSPRGRALLERPQTSSTAGPGGPCGSAHAGSFRRR